MTPGTPIHKKGDYVARRMLPPTTTDLMAAIILAVLAVVPLLKFALHYRPMRYTLAQIPVYLIHILYSRIV